MGTEEIGLLEEARHCGGWHVRTASHGSHQDHLLQLGGSRKKDVAISEHQSHSFKPFKMPVKFGVLSTAVQWPELVPYHTADNHPAADAPRTLMPLKPEKILAGGRKS